MNACHAEARFVFRSALQAWYVLRKIVCTRVYSHQRSCIARIQANPARNAGFDVHCTVRQDDEHLEL